MGTATLVELDHDARKPAQDGVSLTVDFDPKSLQLVHHPTGVTGADTTTTSGTWSKFPAQQTGQSTTLSVELTFDTTDTGLSVLAKTGQLVRLTSPDRTNPSAPARRVVRFHWGSFLFDGVVENLQQTIDFFSDTGVPLRAVVALTLSDLKPPDPDTARPPAAPALRFAAGAGVSATGAGAASVSVGGAGASVSVTATATARVGAAAGTTPLLLSQAGDSVQSIAARAGVDVSWKVIAAANGIDNPRLLPPGTVIDLSARLG